MIMHSVSAETSLSGCIYSWPYLPPQTLALDACEIDLDGCCPETCRRQVLCTDG